jgi:hypothetical protein
LEIHLWKRWSQNGGPFGRGLPFGTRVGPNPH